MRFAYFLCGAIFSAAVSAAPAIDKGWTSDGHVATAKAVAIGVPLLAGSLENYSARDLGDKGADLVAQYETKDRKIIGTIFLYAPSRPDAGLTFLATDETIRRRLGSGVTIAEDRLVPINGVADAARRTVYIGKADAKLSGDFDGRVSSTMSLFRVAEWIAVVRVSGPITRSKEISDDLDALVRGLTFGAKVKPFPFNRISTEVCEPSPDRPTISLNHPPSGEALEASLILNPLADDDQRPIANGLLGTIEQACLEKNETSNNIPMLTFRVTKSQDAVLTPRRFILFGDAGIMLLAMETKKEPGEYFVSRHSIGTTVLLGRASGMPSDGELKSILFHSTDQPAVVTIEDKFLSDPRGQTITINCNLTAEGCDKPKK